VDKFSDFNERCVQLFKSINEYHAAGFSNRKIGKLLGTSRTTVAKYIGGDFESLCKKTIRSGLDEYHDYIVKSLKAGMSRKDIYRNVVAMGFSGKQTGAYDYMNKLIAHYGIEISLYWSTSADAIQKQKRIQEYDYITRTALFKYLWMNADLMPEHREYIYKEYPQLCELNACVKEFRQIFETGRMPLLYLFIERYKLSDIKPLSVFAKGLGNDIEAIENAVSSNLSNGFVEGVVNKLKTNKRIMYGRCSRGLLSAKMMYSPNTS